MNDFIYLLITKENNNIKYKGFYSFNKLLKSINVDKDKLNKNSLPVTFNNYTIIKVSVDTSA